MYDVFLSHRGPDVKRHFCEFLSEALRRAGVLAFVDEADLKPGDDAWPTMKTALESAHLVLPVFSKSYAESHWCLDELVLMMRKPEKVMPVFYDVGPNLDDLAKKAEERYACCPCSCRIVGGRVLSPSCVMRVRHHRFVRRVPNCTHDKLVEWKAALKEASKKTGWRADKTSG